MFKAILLTVLTVLTLFIFMAQSDIYASEGKVTFVKGSGKIVRSNGETHLMKKGLEIKQGDTLYVNNNSMVAIVLGKNKSKLKLKPGTVLTINNLLQNKDYTRVNLERGGFVAKVKKLSAQPQDFEVKCGNAVAGVRGTEFSIERSSKTDYKTDFKLGVAKGKVKIEKSNIPVYIKKGKKIKVNHKGHISDQPKEKFDFNRFLKSDED